MSKYSNTIEYKLRTDVDLSGINKLQTSLSKVQSQLTKLKFNSGGMNNAFSAYEEASRTVSKLQAALNKSFNVKVGMTDVNKLTSLLKQSSVDVTRLYTNLSKAGSVGKVAFNNLLGTIGKVNVAMKTTSSLGDKIFNTIGNTVRWGLVAGAFETLRNSVYRATEYVKELDKSLNDIRIVSGQSAEQMRIFAQQANEAAKNLGKTTTEFTNASLIFVQQGYDTAKAKQLAELTLKTANVTGQDTATVSEQLTALINGYQMQGQSIEYVERQVDKLAKVAAVGAADLEELATGFSKVAAVANTLGVSTDQLTAQLSTIISVTREAPEAVGNALKTIYSRLGDLKLGETLEDGMDLGRISQNMEKVGVEVLDASGKMRNMGTIIEDLMKKWQTLTVAQKQGAAESLAGRYQYTRFMALMDNSQMYYDQLQESLNSAGTLEEQQATYMDSLAAKMNSLKAVEEGIVNSLFNSDDIKPVIEALTTILDQVQKVIDTVGGGGVVWQAFASTGARVLSKQLGRSISNLMSNLDMKRIARQFNDADANVLLKNMGLDSSVKGTLSGELLRAAKINKQNAPLMSAEQANMNNEQLQKHIDKINEIQRGYEAVNNEVTMLNGILKETFGLNNDAIRIQDDVVTISDEFQELMQVILGTDDTLEKFTEGISFKDAQRELQEFQIRFDKLSNAAAMGTASVEEIQQVAQRLQKSNLLKFFNNNQKQTISNIASGFGNAAENASLLASIMSELNNKFKENATNVGVSEKRLFGCVEAYQELYDSAKLANQELKSSNDLKEQTFSIQQFATSAINAVGALGQLASSIQMLHSIGKMWTDDDVNTGEKILRTVESLGMILPMIGFSIGTLKNLLGDFTRFDQLGIKQSTIKVKTDATTKSFVANAAAINSIEMEAKEATGALAGLGAGMTAAAGNVQKGRQSLSKSMEQTAAGTTVITSGLGKIGDTAKKTGSILTKLGSIFTKITTKLGPLGNVLKLAANGIKALVSGMGPLGWVITGLSIGVPFISGLLEGTSEESAEKAEEEKKKALEAANQAAEAVSSAQEKRQQYLDFYEDYKKTGIITNDLKKAMVDYAAQLGKVIDAEQIRVSTIEDLNRELRSENAFDAREALKKISEEYGKVENVSLDSQKEGYNKVLDKLATALLTEVTDAIELRFNRALEINADKEDRQTAQRKAYESSVALLNKTNLSSDNLLVFYDDKSGMWLLYGVQASSGQLSELQQVKQNYREFGFTGGTTRTVNGFDFFGENTQFWANGDLITNITDVNDILKIDAKAVEQNTKVTEQNTEEIQESNTSDDTKSAVEVASEVATTQPVDEILKTDAASVATNALDSGWLGISKAYADEGGEVDWGQDIASSLDDSVEPALSAIKEASVSIDGKLPEDGILHVETDQNEPVEEDNTDSDVENLSTIIENNTSAFEALKGSIDANNTVLSDNATVLSTALQIVANNQSALEALKTAIGGEDGTGGMSGFLGGVIDNNTAALNAIGGVLSGDDSLIGQAKQTITSSAEKLGEANAALATNEEKFTISQGLLDSVTQILDNNNKVLLIVAKVISDLYSVVDTNNGVIESNSGFLSNYEELVRGIQSDYTDLSTQLASSHETFTTQITNDYSSFATALEASQEETLNTIDSNYQSVTADYKDVSGKYDNLAAKELEKLTEISGDRKALGEQLETNYQTFSKEMGEQYQNTVSSINEDRSNIATQLLAIIDNNKNIIAGLGDVLTNNTSALESTSEAIGATKSAMINIEPVLNDTVSALDRNNKALVDSGHDDLQTNTMGARNGAYAFGDAAAHMDEIFSEYSEIAAQNAEDVQKFTESATDTIEAIDEAQKANAALVGPHMTPSTSFAKMEQQDKDNNKNPHRTLQDLSTLYQSFDEETSGQLYDDLVVLLRNMLVDKTEEEIKAMAKTLSLSSSDPNFYKKLNLANELLDTYKDNEDLTTLIALLGAVQGGIVELDSIHGLASDVRKYRSTLGLSSYYGSMSNRSNELNQSQSWSKEEELFSKFFDAIANGQYAKALSMTDNALLAPSLFETTYINGHPYYIRNDTNKMHDVLSKTQLDENQISEFIVTYLTHNGWLKSYTNNQNVTDSSTGSPLSQNKKYESEDYEIEQQQRRLEQYCAASQAAIDALSESTEAVLHTTPSTGFMKAEQQDKNEEKRKSSAQPEQDILEGTLDVDDVNDINITGENIVIDGDSNDGDTGGGSISGDSSKSLSKDTYDKLQDISRMFIDNDFSGSSYDIMKDFNALIAMGIVTDSQIQDLTNYGAKFVQYAKFLKLMDEIVAANDSVVITGNQNSISDDGFVRNNGNALLSIKIDDRSGDESRIDEYVQQLRDMSIFDDYIIENNNGKIEIKFKNQAATGLSTQNSFYDFLNDTVGVNGEQSVYWKHELVTGSGYNQVQDAYDQLRQDIVDNIVNYINGFDSIIEEEPSESGSNYNATSDNISTGSSKGIVKNKPGKIIGKGTKKLANKRIVKSSSLSDDIAEGNWLAVGADLFLGGTLLLGGIGLNTIQHIAEGDSYFDAVSSNIAITADAISAAGEEIGQGIIDSPVGEMVEKFIDVGNAVFETFTKDSLQNKTVYETVVDMVSAGINEATNNRSTSERQNNRVTVPDDNKVQLEESPSKQRYETGKQYLQQKYGVDPTKIYDNKTLDFNELLYLQELYKLSENYSSVSEASAWYNAIKGGVNEVISSVIDERMSLLQKAVASAPSAHYDEVSGTSYIQKTIKDLQDQGLFNDIVMAGLSNQLISGMAQSMVAAKMDGITDLDTAQRKILQESELGNKDIINMMFGRNFGFDVSNDTEWVQLYSTLLNIKTQAEKNGFDFNTIISKYQTYLFGKADYVQQALLSDDQLLQYILGEDITDSGMNYYIEQIEERAERQKFIQDSINSAIEKRFAADKTGQASKADIKKQVEEEFGKIDTAESVWLSRELGDMIRKALANDPSLKLDDLLMVAKNNMLKQFLNGTEEVRKNILNYIENGEFISTGVSRYDIEKEKLSTTKSSEDMYTSIFDQYNSKDVAERGGFTWQEAADLVNQYGDAVADLLVKEGDLYHLRESSMDKLEASYYAEQKALDEMLGVQTDLTENTLAMQNWLLSYQGSDYENFILQVAQINQQLQTNPQNSLEYYAQLKLIYDDLFKAIISGWDQAEVSLAEYIAAIPGAADALTLVVDEMFQALQIANKGLATGQLSAGEYADKIRNIAKGTKNFATELNSATKRTKQNTEAVANGVTEYNELGSAVDVASNSMNDMVLESLDASVDAIHTLENNIDGLAEVLNNDWTLKINIPVEEMSQAAQNAFSAVDVAFKNMAQSSETMMSNLIASVQSRTGASAYAITEYINENSEILAQEGINMQEFAAAQAYAIAVNAESNVSLAASGIENIINGIVSMITGTNIEWTGVPEETQGIDSEITVTGENIDSSQMPHGTMHVPGFKMNITGSGSAGRSYSKETAKAVGNANNFVHTDKETGEKWQYNYVATDQVYQDDNGQWYQVYEDTSGRGPQAKFKIGGQELINLGTQQLANGWTGMLTDFLNGGTGGNNVLPPSYSDDGSGGGGGGGGDSGYDPKKLEYVKEEKDLYERINTLLEDVQKDLELIADEQDRLVGDKLAANINKQIKLTKKQIGYEKEKLAIMEEEAATVQQRLVKEAGENQQYNNEQGVTVTIGSIGVMPEYDAEGILSNYDQMFDAYLNRINMYIDLYNQAITEEEQNYIQLQIDFAKEMFEQFKTDYARYDALVGSEMNDQRNKIEQLINSVEDLSIQTLKIAAEAVDNIQKMKEAIIDFNAVFTGSGTKDPFRNASVSIQKLGLYIDRTKKGATSFWKDLIEGAEQAAEAAQTEEERQVAQARAEVYRTAQQRNKVLSGEGKLFGATGTGILDYDNAIGGLYRELINEYETTGEARWYGENAKQLYEDAQAAMEQMVEDYKNLESEIENMKDAIIDMVDYIADVTGQFTKYYDNINDELDHASTIIQMLRGDTDYTSQISIAQAKIANNQAAVAVNNESLDQLHRLLDSQEKFLNVVEVSYDANGNAVQTETKVINPAWQSIYEKIVDLEGDNRSRLESILDNVRAIRDASANQKIDSFIASLNIGGKNEVNTLGDLDWAIEQWELINRNADLYLDDVNRAAETQKLENRYLQMINDATDPGIQRQITEQMKQQLEYLRKKNEGTEYANKLSQYDIEYANAQLDILQKRIALEEAQRNKSTLKLRRDAQGNYSYVYTADQNAIANAENELLDAELNAYNLAKNRSIEMQTNSMSELRNYLDQLKTIMQDQTAGVEVQQQRVQQLSASMEEYMAANSEQFTTATQQAFVEALELLQVLTDENQTAILDAMEITNNATQEQLSEIDERFNSSVTAWIGDITAFNGSVNTLTKELNGVLSEYAESIGEQGTEVANVYNQIADSIDKAVDKTKQLNEQQERFFQIIDDAGNLTSSYINSLDIMQSSVIEHNEAIKQYKETIAELNEKLTKKDLENAAMQAEIDLLTNGGTPGGNGDDSGGDGNGSTGGDNGGNTPIIYSNGTIFTDEELIEGVAGNIWANGSWADDPTRSASLAAKFGANIAYAIQQFVNLGMEALLHDWKTGYYDQFGIDAFDTGGYTGDWDNSGRIAVLHQKELVLNKTDTENMLEAVRTLRDMQMALAMDNSAANFFKNGISNISSKLAGEQMVHIEASFPGVQTAIEIQNALLGLANQASHYMWQDDKRRGV